MSSASSEPYDLTTMRFLQSRTCSSWEACIPDPWDAEDAYVRSRRTAPSAPKSSKEMRGSHHRRPHEAQKNVPSSQSTPMTQRSLTPDPPPLQMPVKLSHVAQSKSHICAWAVSGVTAATPSMIATAIIQLEIFLLSILALLGLGF